MAKTTFPWSKDHSKFKACPERSEGSCLAQKILRSWGRAKRPPGTL